MNEQIWEQRSLAELINLLGATSDRATRRLAYDHLVEQGPRILGAVIAGLKHEDPHIREGCASLLDHLGDDSCAAPLLETMNDAVAAVRRAAVHSLACDRCKPQPLTVDVIPALAELALHDPSTKVRQQAVYGLGLRGADERVVLVLEAVVTEFSAKTTLSKKERGVLFAARWGLNRHQRAHKYQQAQP
ncbi:MAG: HEAT repeat domain-containing protein [Caldilineaceae bacterium]